MEKKKKDYRCGQLPNHFQSLHDFFIPLLQSDILLCWSSFNKTQSNDHLRFTPQRLSILTDIIWCHQPLLILYSFPASGTFLKSSFGLGEGEEGCRGVLPDKAYTGKCCWAGYGVWPVCPKQGIILILYESVLIWTGWNLLVL